MKVLLWNIEWAGGRARRSKVITKMIADHAPDIVCLTETTAAMVPDGGHAISGGDDWSYAHDGSCRKVALWSKSAWDQVDEVGSPDLPPGRFVSGVTGGIRFVGVCIPWYAAHVSSGRRDRRQWDEHRKYLKALKPILRSYEVLPERVCVLGDFNQRVPPVKPLEEVYGKMVDCLGGATIRTGGIKDGGEKLLIDHVASTAELEVTPEGLLPKSSPEGLKLTDHTGLVVQVTQDGA